MSSPRAKQRRTIQPKQPVYVTLLGDFLGFTICAVAIVVAGPFLASVANTGSSP